MIDSDTRKMAVLPKNRTILACYSDWSLADSLATDWSLVWRWKTDTKHLSQVDGWIGWQQGGSGESDSIYWVVTVEVTDDMQI